MRRNLRDLSPPPAPQSRVRATNRRWQSAWQRRSWQRDAAGDPRPPRAQTTAAGRFRGGARAAGGGRALEPAAARGQSAGRAGRGRERARAPHTPAPGDAHSRVGAAGRPAPSDPPHAGSLAGVCPTGVGLLLSALSGPQRQGPRTGPQPRTAWTRRLSRSRRRCERPEAAPRRPPRRPARTETGPTSARPRRGRSRAPGAAASPAPSEE